MPRPFLFLLFLPPAAPRPWNWRPGSFVRKIPPPRTCASGSYRRERSSPPPGANCLGCNPRARALSSCTGASVACRPLARIDSGGTPPRTCASGSMSTSEASVSPAASVGPGRSPLGTRTPVSLAFSHALRAYKGKVEAFLKKSFTKKLYSRYRSAPAAHVR